MQAYFRFFYEQFSGVSYGGKNEETSSVTTPLEIYSGSERAFDPFGVYRNSCVDSSTAISPSRISDTRSSNALMNRLEGFSVRTVEMNRR